MKHVLIALPCLLTLACGQTKTLPTPGALKAGLATVNLDAPVGVALGGYGRHRNNAEPGSPWSERLPSSRGIQTRPTARATALTDGLKSVVFVRLDLCLTTATLRFRAEAKLKAKGRDATLLVTSTHTHAGPARYFRPVPIEGATSTDPTAMAMDVYDVEMEERLSTSIAEAADQALAHLVPVSMGHATRDFCAFNNDRRCENDDLYGPDFKDKTLTVIRLDEVDEAGQPTKPLTAFLNFAMHGTVLGSANTLMSVDAPGYMELFASDELGIPVTYLQGSAGDVSPRTGGNNVQDFQALEHLGRVSAPLVAETFKEAQPGPAPKNARLQRFELPVDLTRAAMGYAIKEFPEYGAIGCGLGGENCPPIENAPKDVICLPLSRRAFSQTTVVALRLEDLLFVSLPGEPTTAIGARVKELAALVPGVSQAVVVGYAQDHFGYILEEKDYLRLGYEPTVSPWGWKFGDFIVGKANEAVALLGKVEPTPLLPPVLELVPRVPLAGTLPPGPVAPVGDTERLETARFTFQGGDPTLGTPDVFLEREEGGGFVTVMATPTRRAQVGPELVLRYDASPTQANTADAPTREHRWTVEWETLEATPLGTYRVVAQGQAKTGTTVAPYEVRSAPFAVTAAKSVGSSAVATLDAAGTLKVTLRFPPNPSQRNASGETIGRYRLRDTEADPVVGSLVKGGTLQATVTLPDATTVTPTLTWDASQSAYVGHVAAQTGTTKVAVAAGGAVDAQGNANGQAVEVSVTR